MPQMYPGIQSGGRTRHIINIASPNNEEVLAYTFTETTSAPSAATDGYKNTGLQKTLHILAMNNNTDAHVIIPIEGVERIAVQCSTYAGSNNVTCYLGVNTI
mgnify:CR=1 FL=1